MKNSIFKYEGVIKGFDLSKINRDTFPKMIKAGMFETRDLSQDYKGCEYFGMELTDQNEEINNFYLYNQKEFHLKEDVLENMFDRCALNCESNDDLEIIIEKLQLELYIQISALSKIRYLKKRIFETMTSLDEPRFYLLYKEGIKTWGYRTWYDFFKFEQTENEDFYHIFQYLIGDGDFVPVFIEKIWKDYFLTKGVIDFCTNEILCLEKLTGLSEADVLVESTSDGREEQIQIQDERYNNPLKLKDSLHHIFSGDGQRLFEYIVSRSSKTNKAFFSYLYFYMKDLNKIILFADDSKEYRDYIVKRYEIQKFSKIQKTDPEKDSSMRSKNFKLFDAYRKDFYDFDTTVEK